MNQDFSSVLYSYNLSYVKKSHPYPIFIVLLIMFVLVLSDVAVACGWMAILNKDHKNFYDFHSNKEH